MTQPRDPLDAAIVGFVRDQSAAFAQQEVPQADWTEPHPPSRPCMCPSCIPSFDDRFKPQQAAQPVAWLMQAIGTSQVELARPNQKAIHKNIWTDAFPVYTAPPAQAQQPNAATPEDMAVYDGITQRYFKDVQAQQAAGVPEGWVPLRIEFEPGYPEDVAFGPQIMMDRLKKWLDKHFAALAAQRAAGTPDSECHDHGVHDMLRDWLAEADSRNNTLIQHLHAVLEVARTWQPDYATAMDIKTLDLAAAEVGHKPPAAPTAAAQVPEDVRRDAERYRWLRDSSDAPGCPDETPAVVVTNSDGDIISMSGYYLTHCALDESIDAAMSAQQAQAAQEGGA